MKSRFCHHFERLFIGNSKLETGDKYVLGVSIGNKFIVLYLQETNFNNEACQSGMFL
jgi:hypothetical protein